MFESEKDKKQAIIILEMAAIVIASNVIYFLAKAFGAFPEITFPWWSMIVCMTCVGFLAAWFTIAVWGFVKAVVWALRGFFSKEIIY